MIKLLVSSALVLAVFVSPSRGLAQEGGGLVEKGKRVFTDQGCYGCHTVEKFGTPIAPDLSHIGAKYNIGDLKLWLESPAAQRPTAHMPKLKLTDVEVQSLAAYLASLR